MHLQHKLPRLQFRHKRVPRKPALLHRTIPWHITGDQIHTIASSELLKLPRRPNQCFVIVTISSCTVGARRPTLHGPPLPLTLALKRSFYTILRHEHATIKHQYVGFDPIRIELFLELLLRRVHVVAIRLPWLVRADNFENTAWHHTPIVALAVRHTT